MNESKTCRANSPQQEAKNREPPTTEAINERTRRKGEQTSSAAHCQNGTSNGQIDSMHIMQVDDKKRGTEPSGEIDQGISQQEPPGAPSEGRKQTSHYALLFIPDGLPHCIQHAEVKRLPQPGGAGSQVWAPNRRCVLPLPR